jgi:hypothetical protein
MCTQRFCEVHESESRISRVALLGRHSVNLRNGELTGHLPLAVGGVAVAKLQTLALFVERLAVGVFLVDLRTAVFFEVVLGTTVSLIGLRVAAAAWVT